MKSTDLSPTTLTMLRTAALVLLALLLCIVTARSQSLTSTTTFQGTLNFEGTPANGTFDLTYRIVNSAADAADGAPGGPMQTNLAVSVSRGVFTTEIEIPLAALDWPQRFVDLQIRPSGDGLFQPLAPRLPITPVPAALVADTARAVSAGAVTAEALGPNAVTTSGLADSAVTSAKVRDGQLLKSLNGLKDDVMLEAGEGLTLTTVGNRITLAMPGFCLPWCLYGNVGTAPAPAQTVSSTYPNHHFVGTRDNKALELRVNKLRALRVEPAGVNFAPNLLGGYGKNVAAPGTRGGTIGGGGAVNAENELVATTGFGMPHFTTISGGLANRISSSTNATISGGRANVIERDSHDSTVGGGSENLIRENSPGSIIAAGVLNHIGVSSDGSTVSGGFSNHMELLNDYSTIAGGAFNEIRWLSSHSSIGGGLQNIIAGDNNAATIGGGQENYVMSENYAVTIAGGLGNFIGKSSDRSAIGGGSGNQIMPIAEGSTIAGGSQNTINGGPSSQPCAIGGGAGNLIGNSAYSTIAGGYLNMVIGGQFSQGSVIGGGIGNTLQYGTEFSTISGGNANTISQDSKESVIAGGGGNIIMANSAASVIGGGRLNYVGGNSPSSTIGGGESNLVESASTWSTIGGGFSNRIAELIVSSTIGGGATNSITYDSQIITISGGGGNRVGSETAGATIGGGYVNDIGGRSHHATIGGGHSNVIASIAPSATIAGGDHNTIFGGAFSREASAIGGGRGNYINGSAEFATIPGGLEAYARRHGQMAHASGSFANAGDAQTSTHVLRGTSTGTALQELFLDGVSKRLTIPADSTYTFEVHVAGRSQAGASAGYKICGVIKNVGGTVSFVGTPVMPVAMEDVAIWNAVVAADVANSSLSIKASGSANTPVRWVATIRTTEVVFP